MTLPLSSSPPRSFPSINNAPELDWSQPSSENFQDEGLFALFESLQENELLIPEIQVAVLALLESAHDDKPQDTETIKNASYILRLPRCLLTGYVAYMLKTVEAHIWKLPFKALAPGFMAEIIGSLSQFLDCDNAQSIIWCFTEKWTNASQDRAKSKRAPVLHRAVSSFSASANAFFGESDDDENNLAGRIEASKIFSCSQQGSELPEFFKQQNEVLDLLKNIQFHQPARLDHGTEIFPDQRLRKEYYDEEVANKASKDTDLLLFDDLLPLNSSKKDEDDGFGIDHQASKQQARLAQQVFDLVCIQTPTESASSRQINFCGISRSLVDMCITGSLEYLRQWHDWPQIVIVLPQDYHAEIKQRLDTELRNAKRSPSTYNGKALTLEWQKDSEPYIVTISASLVTERKKEDPYNWLNTVG